LEGARPHKEKVPREGKIDLEGFDGMPPGRAGKVTEKKES